MKQKLIDKDAVVAEIQRMQDAYIAKLESRGMGHEEAVMASISYVNGIKDVINTFEVKKVNLKKEIEEWLHNGDITDTRFDDYRDSDIESTAKHFFELGIKAQKDNIRHYMDETPNYPCDILFVTDVGNMFLYKYMENGRPVDRETPYFHNIQNGKCWYYCDDIVNIH